MCNKHDICPVNSKAPNPIPHLRRRPAWPTPSSLRSSRKRRLRRTRMTSVRPRRRRQMRRRTLRIPPQHQRNGLRQRPNAEPSPKGVKGQHPRSQLQSLQSVSKANMKDVKDERKNQSQLPRRGRWTRKRSRRRRAKRRQPSPNSTAHVRRLAWLQNRCNGTLWIHMSSQHMLWHAMNPNVSNTDVMARYESKCLQHRCFGTL